MQTYRLTDKRVEDNKRFRHLRERTLIVIQLTCPAGQHCKCYITDYLSSIDYTINCCRARKLDRQCRITTVELSLN